MICPKCRTKYPEGITVCPDCGIELFGLLGQADAPDEEPDDRKIRRKAAEYGQDIPQTVELYADRTAQDVDVAQPQQTQQQEESAQADESNGAKPTVDEEYFSVFEESGSHYTDVSSSSDGDLSPVVYRSSNANDEPSGSSNGLGVFFLIISLLFIAASAVMFYLGRSGISAADTADTAAVIARFSAF